MHRYLLILCLMILIGCQTKKVIKPEYGADHKKSTSSYSYRSSSKVSKYVSPPSFTRTKQLNFIYQRTKDFPVHTELAIAIIQNGQKQFLGVRRVRDTIELIPNEHSLFEIGSISKVFTATLLAQFVTDRKIELEEPIQDHLEYPINLQDKINFKQLANHSSGLPRLPSNFFAYTKDLANPYKEYGEHQLKEYLTGKIELISTPGLTSNYSNLGAGVLGYMLTEISGQNYNKLLSKHIFSNYGMGQSTCIRDDIKGTLVLPRDANGKETAYWDFKVLAPAGGIFSSVADLSKFAEAHFNKDNEVLSLTREKTLSIKDGMDIALGWHIINNNQKKDWYWHNGGTGGFSSSMTMDVDSRNAIIILSNLSSFHKEHRNIDNLCFKLMSSLY